MVPDLETNGITDTPPVLKKKSPMIIMISLSALLIGFMGYTTKLIFDKEAQKAEIAKVVGEKQQIIADLQVLKENCDRVIEENSSLSEEFEAERARVVELLEEVKNAESDLAEYKVRYSAMESKLLILTRENEILKAQNILLRQEFDSTKSVLLAEIESFREMSSLQGIQPMSMGRGMGYSDLTSSHYMDDIYSELEEDVASELTISNIDISALQVKKSGEEVETTKAKQTKKLKIDFVVDENMFAPKQTKKYYIQVVNSKMNVLSESGQRNYNEQSLPYTVTSDFDYDNSSAKVTATVTLNKFEKGSYLVSIFDQDKLVASKQITLE